MAVVACVIRKASAVGANKSIFEIWLRDTVTTGNDKKVGEYIHDAATYGGLSAGQITEFTDSANTLGTIIGKTTYGSYQDL